MKKYVIYSEQDGVFVGFMFGLGFWSKMDAAGQDEVVGFTSEQEAIDFYNKHLIKRKDASVIEIDSDRSGDTYVTMSECIFAGIPAWEI